MTLLKQVCVIFFFPKKYRGLFYGSLNSFPYKITFPLGCLEYLPSGNEVVYNAQPELLSSAGRLTADNSFASFAITLHYFRQ